MEPKRFQLKSIFGGCSIMIYYYCIILYACQINTSLKILHDDTWGTSPERVRPREARDELVKPVQRPHTGLIIFSTKQRYNKRSISTLGKHCLVSDWKKHIYWKLVRWVSYMKSFNSGINLTYIKHL